MQNYHLKCQCDLLVNSILLFKNTSISSCCDSAHPDNKREQAYINKLNKKLDSLIELLNKSP